MYPKNRTWAEISLDNILHNYKEFRRISKASKIMCLVKANAYGHGSVIVAKSLEAEGCDYLAVAALDEGIELRAAGISIPILILNYIALERIDEALTNNLTMTVFDIDSAKVISEKANTTVKIHIKIDTGMTRVGLNIDVAVDAIDEISKLANIYIEGLFTHFASSDEYDKSYTQLQFDRFMKVKTELDLRRINIPIKHVANSAASIMYSEMHLDMIRLGVSLYGCYPSDEIDKSRVLLKPAMQLKTRVIRINNVESGTPVSYGRIFTTEHQSQLATIPIGYADGFSRVLVGKARAIVGGDYVPVVGKICMDQCMLDITEVPQKVQVNDEVIIFGSNGELSISIEEVAAKMGTINYEIMCMVSRRVPRFYFKDGRVTNTENYLININTCP